MKIDVTLLESYRYWRNEQFYTQESERKATDELIARIRGERTPLSIPALRGIAFAKVIEEPEKYFDPRSNTYYEDGFRFDAISVANFQLLIPENAMREIWLPRVYIDDHYLVGRADIATGNTLGDAKLITKSLNDKKYDSYEKSIQWKAYLMMADMDEFKFYVAHGKERRKDDVIIIDQPHILTFYRTKETDNEVIYLAKDFARFAEPYLPAAA